MEGSLQENGLQGKKIFVCTEEQRLRIIHNHALTMLSMESSSLKQICFSSLTNQVPDEYHFKMFFLQHSKSRLYKDKGVYEDGEDMLTVCLVFQMIVKMKHS